MLVFDYNNKLDLDIEVKVGDVLDYLGTQVVLKKGYIMYYHLKWNTKVFSVKDKSITKFFEHFYENSLPFNQAEIEIAKRMGFERLDELEHLEEVSESLTDEFYEFVDSATEEDLMKIFDVEPWGFTSEESHALIKTPVLYMETLED